MLRPNRFRTVEDDGIEHVGVTRYCTRSNYVRCSECPTVTRNQLPQGCSCRPTGHATASALRQ